ncbi:MAG TPA: hypothetical protein VEW05_14240 [Candidatus Polarisedimenticolia bacterium]|nr:hypothetical protein [Candidatus Polarisedimenticolia bacterium]
MKAPMKTCLLVPLLAVSTFAKETYAPLPEKLMQAKTVYVENKTKDAQIADVVFRELLKWKRYVLVTDKSKAELVFVLTETTHEAIYSNGTRVSNQIGSATITTGGQIYSYTAGSLTLEIQDAEGTVWANTKPFSRKGATRDLMNDLRQRIERQEKTDQKERHLR